MADEKGPKDQRIPIMMSASEVASIDDWRVAGRIWSRSEAIRRLVHIGLMIDRYFDALAAETNTAHERVLDLVHAALDIRDLKDRMSPELMEYVTALADAAGPALDGMHSLTLRLEEALGPARKLTAETEIRKAFEEAARARAQALTLREQFESLTEPSNK